MSCQNTKKKKTCILLIENKLAKIANISRFFAKKEKKKKVPIFFAF